MQRPVPVVPITTAPWPAKKSQYLTTLHSTYKLLFLGYFFWTGRPNVPEGSEFFQVGLRTEFICRPRPP